MHDKEAIEMMRRAAEEIKGLRRQIDVLAPKAHAYDSLSVVIRQFPQQAQGYGEDVAWMLEKRIRELEAAEKTGSQP